jgi:hypothetical protein
MTVTLCKFCKAEQSSYRSLRIHCEIEHRDEYIAVQNWLGKTVKPKLITFKRLANDSLIGYREIRHLDG